MLKNLLMAVALTGVTVAANADDAAGADRERQFFARFG